jgi:Uma2 family endonuclease
MSFRNTDSSDAVMIAWKKTPMTAVSTRPQYYVELIDGREVEKPLPRKLHALIQTYLLLVLNRDLLPKQYQALPELNVLTGGQTVEGRREYIVPDVVVVARSARYKDGDLTEPPLWGVEILSPGQTIGDLFERAGRLLKLGCPLVWVIWPEKCRAWEYSNNDLQEVKDQLTAQLPNESNSIKVKLAEMWAELD